MPEVVRRRSKGPEVSTGRGITASGDGRLNVRLSQAELEATRTATRAAGFPSEAAHMRDTYLRAIGYIAPERAQPTGPIPWLVPEDGDVVPASAPGDDIAGTSSPDDDIADQCGSVGDPSDPTTPVCVLAPGHEGPHKSIEVELRAVRPRRSKKKSTKSKRSGSQQGEATRIAARPPRAPAPTWRDFLKAAAAKVLG